MTSSETPYRFEQFDGYAIITLLPQLNDSQWADIEKVGTELVSRINSINNPRFIVDLSELTYMGSAMVALIVRLWKSVKDNKKGKMVVVNKHEMVFEVLKLAGLHNVWTIVQTREEGLKALGVSGRSASVSFAGGGSSDAGSVGVLLTVLGVLAVVGAAVALALMMTGSELLSDRTAMAVQFVFAAIGLIVGMVAAIKESHWRQWVGIGVVAASVILVFVGILFAPGGVTEAATPNPSSPAPETPPATPEAPTE